MGIGDLGNWFKKRLSDQGSGTATMPQPGFNSPMMGSFNVGQPRSPGVPFAQGFQPNIPAQTQPKVATPVAPSAPADNRSFIQKLFDSVNMSDNGKSWSTPVATQNKSYMQQAGDFYKGIAKPFWETGDFAMQSAQVGLHNMTGNGNSEEAQIDRAKRDQSFQQSLAPPLTHAAWQLAEASPVDRAMGTTPTYRKERQIEGQRQQMIKGGMDPAQANAWANTERGKWYEETMRRAGFTQDMSAKNMYLKSFGDLGTAASYVIAPAAGAQVTTGRQAVGEAVRQGVLAGTTNAATTAGEGGSGSDVAKSFGTGFGGGVILTGAGYALPKVLPQRSAAVVADQANQANRGQVQISNPKAMPVDVQAKPTGVTIGPETANKVELPQSRVQVQDSVPQVSVSTGKAQKLVTMGQGSPEFPSQIRNRGFIDTIFNDTNTPVQVKQALADLDTTYMTRNTKELQTKAANLVKSHPDIAQQLANNAHDDISVAVGSELIKKLQKDGNYTAAIDTANALAKNLTEAGRTVQAASIYGKLTPDGVLRFAQSEINKYNKATGKSIKLEATAAEKLVKMADDVQKMPEGYERAVATQKLISEIQAQMPATLAEKLGTLQTMAQLLNIKTNTRNLAGNTMFGALDNLSQTVATPVDKLLSYFTGERTTGLPDLKTQAKGFVEGGKKGISEAAQGINIGPTTQFDLKSTPVFRGKILGTLEKTMNGTLTGADRAAYTAAFDDTIRMLKKFDGSDVVTPAMMEQAHHTALYRTFQDTNAVSGFFVGMKKALNKVGIGVEGKRFGLGDIVLKYPKTPGNLLARGLDYSPVGFVRSIFEATKPLFGQEFNQKAFVDSFSRAAVGSSSAFGIGYVLSDNGIITAQPETNKDLRNVQKTAGLGGYQINASALKRWIATGFNKEAAKLREGDTLVSYDWAQPIAIPISAGAALGENKPQRAGAEATNSIVNSANTLVEQPLLQGVQRLFGGYGGLSDAAVNTAVSAPASFVPTALSQINQLGDNSSRITTSDNPGVEAMNLVKAKVPGLAQTLPQGYDVLGNPKERYQNGTNNPFNVLVNPAFVSQYEPSAAASEVLNLYNRTGETKQTPNTAPGNVKINDSKVVLSGQQQSDYQKFTGERTSAAINQLIKDPAYQSLPDTEKVKLLSGLQTDINNAAKIQVMGDKPADITSGTASVLANTYNAGGTSDLSAQAGSIQEKVAIEKFKTSSDKTMLLGENYYFKTRDGTVKSMPKIEYDFNQADSVLTLGMDRAQAADDIGTWMGLAEQKYNALEAKKQLYDPGTEADKIATITLAQENLMQKVETYNGYGGFKKGGSGKGKGGSLPSISVGIPSGLMGPVVTNSSYSAPKFRLKNKGSVSVKARRPSVKISAPKKL